MSLSALVLLALVAPAHAGKKHKKSAAPPAPVEAPTLTPVAYNDAIVNEQTAIGEKMQVFSAAMEGTDGSAVSAALEALEGRTQQALVTLRAMPAIDGSTELRDSAVTLFEFYLRSAQVDYRRLMEILADQEVTVEEQPEVDAIIARMNAEEQTLDAAFGATQQAFADRYGFTLVGPEPASE